MKSSDGKGVGRHQNFSGQKSDKVAQLQNICIPWTLCVYVYVIHINLFLQSRRLRLDTSPQPSQRGLFAFLFMQSPTWLGHDVLNGSSQLAHSYTKHGRLRISSSSDLVNR